MNNFAHLKLLVAVIGTFTTCYGSAQVYEQSSVKTLKTLTHWSAAYDDVVDCATDAAGNRYFVGLSTTGSGTDSYLVKMTKKGFLGYYVTIPNTQATAIAADNQGDVYITAFNGGTGEYGLMKFDQISGAMAWQRDTPYGGPIYDLAVNSAGIPITGGAGYFGGSTSHGLLLHWDPTNVNVPNGFYNPSTSTIYKIAIRASDDKVFGSGQSYDSENVISSGTFLTMSPDFNGADLSSFTAGDNGEYLYNLTIDPITGVAIAEGQIFADDSSLEQPVVATCYDGDGALKGNNYPFIAYSDNGVGTDIKAGSEGNIYFAITNGHNTPDPQTANIYVMSADPTDPSVLLVEWYAMAPNVYDADYAAAVGLAVDKNGPILMVSSNLTVGTGATSYMGYQTCSFTTDGTRIDRKVFGIHALTPDLYDNPFQPNVGIVVGGGFLTLYGQTANPNSYIVTAQLNDGPDDVYRVDEDETLTIGLAKSVLNNDGNGHQLAPITAQVVTSSISAGIQSLTLNPNGTFTATFNSNFNGVAKFNYRVKQNGSVIATNKVKINVKAKNDAPTATDDTFSVAKNSSVTSLNVLSNDSDLDMDELTILSKTNNANATIGITVDKKFITFKPKPNYTGDVTFDYTIRDPQGLQSTAHVVVHVS